MLLYFCLLNLLSFATAKQAKHYLMTGVLEKYFAFHTETAGTGGTFDLIKFIQKKQKTMPSTGKVCATYVTVSSSLF